MSRNETEIDVPVEVAWAVLADPRRYGAFVVGSKTIRRFDPRWPAVGAALHHRIGFGPLALKDATEVLEVDEPRRLHVDAGMGPLGASAITFHLEALDATRCRVAIEEWPVRGIIAATWNPAFEAGMWLRNQELLRRLARLAEERAETMGRAGQSRR